MKSGKQKWERLPRFRLPTSKKLKNMTKTLQNYALWFITGSQHLYGEETLRHVADHSRIIARALDNSSHLPVRVEWKTVITTSDQLEKILQEANAAANCIGIITWMHTFSPARMWIRGLNILRKPILHLHTQFNAEIPWESIDMDFMNENQSAHGGREFGFIMSRMRKNRKVVVGHWQEEAVQQQIGQWSRVAAGWAELQQLKVARIGDNMREVAVTEGDKVAAQIQLGFSVNGYGVGDLVEFVNGISEKQVRVLLDEYAGQYELDDDTRRSTSLFEAARIELGLRAFLDTGGFKAFTDTFENLHGLHQLPGIAVQRLMNDGFGFGAEGDWKTAALLRASKVMASGLDGGTSFMEDYTYHFGQRPQVLGAHMLEICPSIAASKPRCEVHPLSIGGKNDPARLVFDVAPGPAINVSLIDMGNRFRLIVNEVEAVPVPAMPRLPVARVLWDPLPNLTTAAATWILAGGAHHTVFSKALTTAQLEDLAEIAGIELLVIDRDTQLRAFKDQVRWNEVYYHLFGMKY